VSPKRSTTTPKIFSTLSMSARFVFTASIEEGERATYEQNFTFLERGYGSRSTK
jgi:hypothetical protein